MDRQTFLSPSLLAFLFCLGALLVSRTVAEKTKCNPPDGSSSTCVCDTGDGVIDLTPLSGKKGKPRFTGVKGDQGLYVYDYNPCNKYTDSAHSKCADVYICQGAVGTQSAGFVVGNKVEQIYQDGTEYYIDYTTTDGIREGIVNLKCDQGTDGTIKFIQQQQETQQTKYIFNLTSCHACPGGCNRKAGVSSGYIGIIIIVLVLVAIVTYFIVGGVLMKVHYEATGSDIIPNKGFWTALPFLIKDGVLFTFSPCVELVRSKRNDYQKI